MEPACSPSWPIEDGFMTVAYPFPLRASATVVHRAQHGRLSYREVATKLDPFREGAALSYYHSTMPKHDAIYDGAHLANTRPAGGSRSIWPSATPARHVR